MAFLLAKLQRELWEARVLQSGGSFLKKVESADPMQGLVRSCSRNECREEPTRTAISTSQAHEALPREAGADQKPEQKDSGFFKSAAVDS